MKRNDDWFIYIQDDDRKLYAVTAPISGRLLDDWLDKVADEQNSGREITYQVIPEDQLREIEAHAKNNGLSVTDVQAIIDIPSDRSSDYLGKLPKYADSAERSRVVQLLCKGKCGASRWAVMNKIYPGKDSLRKASHGEYKAKCLRCGSIARDNYNWHR